MRMDRSQEMPTSAFVGGNAASRKRRMGLALIVTGCLIADAGLVVLLIKAFDLLVEHVSPATIVGLLGAIVIVGRVVSDYRAAVRQLRAPLATLGVEAVYRKTSGVRYSGGPMRPRKITSYG